MIVSDSSDPPPESPSDPTEPQPQPPQVGLSTTVVWDGTPPVSGSGSSPPRSVYVEGVIRLVRTSSWGTNWNRRERMGWMTPRIEDNKETDPTEGATALGGTQMSDEERPGHRS